MQKYGSCCLIARPCCLANAPLIGFTTRKVCFGSIVVTFAETKPGGITEIGSCGVLNYVT